MKFVMPTAQQTITLLHTALDIAERLAPVFGPEGVVVGKMLEAVTDGLERVRGDPALLAEIAAAKSEAQLDALSDRLADVERRRQELLAEV